MTEPTLADRLDEVWAILADDLAQPAPRQPISVATNGLDGRPQLRSVVLREVRRDQGEIAFYTDARSTKVAELRRDARASVLLWRPDREVQLRLDGEAQIETGAEIVELWRSLSRAAWLNYSHEPAPGQGLAEPGGYRQRPRSDNLARIVVCLGRIDYISLARTGHRRAQFRAGNDWRGQWLSP